jgi:hypothetical protein
VGLAAAGAVGALRILPGRWPAAAGGALLGAAVVLQANALGLLVDRFWT